MHKMKLAALAVAAACVSAPAMAASTWVGTADYGVETVGPFNTYDLPAGVLLLDPTSGTTADGYYQSYVGAHLLDGVRVDSPLLSSGQYEITMVANFGGSLTSADAHGQTFSVGTGNFSLWLDTSADASFNADSGFQNGLKIMEGTVLGGAASTVNYSGMQFGGGALQLQVTGYDAGVFNPDTIGGGDNTFTMRLGMPGDAAFLGAINSVQGHAYQAGDLKFATGGTLILTPVPEPESYGMLLAGLGLIGAIARRRIVR